jgi:hypothetical protein
MHHAVKDKATAWQFRLQGSLMGFLAAAPATGHEAETPGLSTTAWEGRAFAPVVAQANGGEPAG